MNRSAKLLIVAYKTLKRNEPEIAKEIFAEAMEDESAPQLMEHVFDITKAGDNDDDLPTGGDDNDNDDNDNDDDLSTGGDDNDNDDDDDDNKPVLSTASLKKLRGIANRIAA